MMKIGNLCKTRVCKASPIKLILPKKPKISLLMKITYSQEKINSFREIKFPNHIISVCKKT